MSTPTLAPLPPFPRPEVVIPTVPPCPKLVEFPPDGGLPCGGICQGSSISWGLSTRSPIKKEVCLDYRLVKSAGDSGV